MEEFSGATATSIIQEFYINMPLSNLVSLIKNNADEEIDITSKSSNKYRYQANRVQRSCPVPFTDPSRKIISKKKIKVKRTFTF